MGSLTRKITKTKENAAMLTQVKSVINSYTQVKIGKIISIINSVEDVTYVNLKCTLQIIVHLEKEKTTKTKNIRKWINMQTPFLIVMIIVD